MTESLDSKSPRIPLATLLMGLSTPGVIAELGYYLVDNGLLLAPIRDSVKSFVDEFFCYGLQSSYPVFWFSACVPSSKSWNGRIYPVGRD